MKLFVVDTETTGFLGAEDRNGRKHEVVQFSGILLSQGLVIERVVNRYCKTTTLMSEGALNVHKLTDKKIDTLSEGKFFERIVEEEGLRDLVDVTWVFYNAAFDKGIINQTLTQNGYAPLDFGKKANVLSYSTEGTWFFDMMYAMQGIVGKSRKVKLSYAVDQYIGSDVFRQVCAGFKQQHNIVDPLVGDLFHSAIYDSLGVSLLLSKFKNVLFD